MFNVIKGAIYEIKELLQQAKQVENLPIKGKTLVPGVYECVISDRLLNSYLVLVRHHRQYLFLWSDCLIRPFIFYSIYLISLLGQDQSLSRNEN